MTYIKAKLTYNKSMMLSNKIWTKINEYLIGDKIVTKYETGL